MTYSKSFWKSISVLTNWIHLFSSFIMLLLDIRIISGMDPSFNYGWITHHAGTCFDCAAILEKVFCSPYAVKFISGFYQVESPVNRSPEDNMFFPLVPLIATWIIWSRYARLARGHNGCEFKAPLRPRSTPSNSLMSSRRIGTTVVLHVVTISRGPFEVCYLVVHDLGWIMAFLEVK